MKTSTAISLIVLFLLGNAVSQRREQVATFEGKSKLLKRDRESLAHAYAEGKTEVMLVIAAAPATNAAVATQLASLGGKIRYRDDEVDYLRARIPIGNVEQIARLRNIDSINLDTVPLSATSYPDSTTTAPQLALNPPAPKTPTKKPHP